MYTVLAGGKTLLAGFVDVVSTKPARRAWYRSLILLYLTIIDIKQCKCNNLIMNVCI